MYEIYTTGGGVYIVDILNGVAALVGANDYFAAMKISALVAVFIMMMTVAFNANFSITVKWLGTFIVLYNVMMVPKATVNVVDRINPSLAPSIVGNVPYGLAVLASLVSQIGDGMTSLAEQAYSLPDDLQYQKYGMIFGSQLLAKTMEIKIVDTNFAASMTSFAEECVFGDLNLGWYTWDDLKIAPDIWQFLTETHTPSTLRSFVYKDASGTSIVTCNAGATMLGDQWAGQVSKSADVFAPSVYNGHSPAEAKTLLLSNLPIANDYLMGVSSTASQILQQTMMINELNYALKDNAAKTGSSTALDIYANARTDAQTEESYKIIASRAGMQLSKMKVVFEAIYYGSFPLIFLLMLWPEGFSFFKVYAFGLAWLQIWGPMNAILHRVMMGEARFNTFGISTMPDATNALTLVSHAGISAVNNEIAVTAGYFAATIPFLSLMLTKTGVSAVSSIATSYLGISHGAASQAAHETTTGNISVGNSNVNNHSHDNINANKINTSGYVDSSSMRSVGMGGMSSTSFASGNVTYDKSATISNLGDAKLNVSESTANKFSQEAGHMENLAKQESIASSNHLSTAYEQTGQLMHTLGHSQASGVDYRKGLTSEQSKAVDDFNQHSKRFSQQEGISENMSARLLASASTGANLGSFFKGNIEASASGEYASKESWDHAKEYLKQHNVKDSISVGTSIAENRNLNIADSKGHSLTDGINTNLREARSLDESSNLHHSKAASLNESASKIMDNSASINMDMSQKYVDWLATQPYEGSANPSSMGYAGAKELLSGTSQQKQLLQEQYQQRFMDNESSKLYNFYSSNKQADLQKGFNDNANDIRDNKHSEITTSHNTRDVQIKELNAINDPMFVNNDNFRTEIPKDIEGSKVKIIRDNDNGKRIETNVNNKLEGSFIHQANRYKIIPENDAE